MGRHALKVAKIEINIELCKGCKLCMAFCPKQRIRVSKKLNRKGMPVVEFLDKEGRCIGCTQCALMCPEAAITVWR